MRGSSKIPVSTSDGNITCFASNEATLGGKWLELLSEIAPGLKRAAIIFNPDAAPASAYVPSFETAARSLKIEPIIARVHSDAEIETAFVALGRKPGGPAPRKMPEHPLLKAKLGPA
jgi:putative ABC transport system substrate-binding protein